jgi:hypothetical protein
MRKCLLGFLLAGTASIGFASAAASLAGRWEVTSSTSYGETYYFNLVMTETNGQLAGRLTLPDGSEVELQNVILEANQLSFEVWIQGTGYTVQAKVEGDALSGTWQGGGDSGPVRATRAK